ncbi:unnamed protein product [Closterium sp. Yama58-4]|nr:unnamed protein product [Closterium sp. Yama58-4]
MTRGEFGFAVPHTRARQMKRLHVEMRPQERRIPERKSLIHSTWPRHRKLRCICALVDTMADYYENRPVEDEDKDDDVDPDVGNAAKEDAEKLSEGLPRVLIVSRRTLRKNKFVDFVGEYHLDLIVAYGAVPVIVPRVPGVASLLDAFEPIHGVLLCEGEDIDPELYDSQLTADLSPEEIAEIRAAHASDTAIDKAKDSIELSLARRCLERSIPYLGICRGSQVLNVASGGSLYQDVETEVTSRKGLDLKHIDYNDYDGHRHPIYVVPETPLAEWFEGSLEKSREATGENELLVNSYHHQGVRFLASRFRPMAFAADGLIEAFYDPDVHCPPRGGFFVGLQFHPERMRRFQDGEVAPGGGPSSPREVFEYPECPRAYQVRLMLITLFHPGHTRCVLCWILCLVKGPAPLRGGFFVGLQFHPERMRRFQDGEVAPGGGPSSPREVFEYPECPRAYQVSSLVLALLPVVVSFCCSLGSSNVCHSKLSFPGGGFSSPREVFEYPECPRAYQSFHAAKVVYEERVVLRRNATEKGGTSALAAIRREQAGGSAGGFGGLPTLPEEKQELAIGASFLKELTPLSGQQVKRLSQVGATVRNASHIKEELERRRNQRSAARAALEALHTSELEEMVAFHRRMAASAEEVLDARKKARGEA